MEDSCRAGSDTSTGEGAVTNYHSSHLRHTQARHQSGAQGRQRQQRTRVNPDRDGRTGRAQASHARAYEMTPNSTQSAKSSAEIHAHMPHSPSHRSDQPRSPPCHSFSTGVAACSAVVLLPLPCPCLEPGVSGAMPATERHHQHTTYQRPPVLPCHTSRRSIV